MKIITIETPDKRIFCFPDSELGRLEAIQFVAGFNSALECYGIWKDGARTIGCMGKDIRPIIQSMRDQLPKEEAPA